MAEKKISYLIAKPNTKVKVDREDLPRIAKHSWRVTETTTGRKRVVTAWREDGKVKTITLGKFLMNPPKGKQVYPRRFQESLDYRKENLIICTLQERQQMLPKNRKKVSSSYRGVSWMKGKSMWRAGITVDGHSMNLGDFESEHDAALAYNQAAMKYFGDKAYQNNIARTKKNRKR